MIAGGGTLSLSGAPLIGGGGTLINDGLIEGSGIIRDSLFTNDGSIVAQHDLVSLGRVTGSGFLLVSSGATLSVANGTCGGGITLSDSASRLILTAQNAGSEISSASGGRLAIQGGGTARLNASDTHLAASLSQAGTSC